MKYSYSPTPSRSSSIVSGSFRSTTSPLPPPAYSAGCMSAAAKRYKYLRRLLKFHQMDFEFALWQMLYLFISPQKVYRNFYYRKQTKSQFARDDPAFLVLLVLWLIGSSIGLAVVLGMGFGGYLRLTLYVIFVDCIGTGMCVATALWYLSNRYLKKDNCLDQDVEWGYAFDIHLNAFFPPLVLLHVFQIIFYQVLFNQGLFVARFFGNALWLVAAGYYLYITFLGYSGLPILQNTQIILYPLPILFFLFILTLSMGYNISQDMMHFYRNGIFY